MGLAKSAVESATGIHCWLGVTVAVGNGGKVGVIVAIGVEVAMDVGVGCGV